MSEFNNTTGLDLEKAGDNKEGLNLAIAQDISENYYLTSKKKYIKKSITLDELDETYNNYEAATNAYINYIKNNKNLSELNKSLIEMLNNDLNKEKYILKNEKNYILEEGQAGGKRKSKGNSKKVSNKPVVSQKKQSIYKEILGKQMKIYKMPDSRKEYVKYKGELLHISDYKDLMKQKAAVKAAVKAVPKAAPKLRNKI
jgi:hypothetical protein